MPLNEAQQLFMLFFGINFALIIDRSHEMYKPWDTYYIWKGRSHNIKRTLTAAIILLIIPLLQFAFFLNIIGTLKIPFDMTFDGISNVVLISLSSFFEFGYFRIYEACLHRYPESFFAEEELIERLDIIRPDFLGHFIPGVTYVLLSALVISIAIYY
jgi:hypothetical protein